MNEKRLNIVKTYHKIIERFAVTVRKFGSIDGPRDVTNGNLAEFNWPTKSYSPLKVHATGRTQLIN